MAPRYVRRFVQDKRLKRLDRDVFHIMREKVLRLFRQGSDFQNCGVVVKADAKELSSLPDFFDYRGRIKLILTSPPYLDVVEYARQNWIRMWFLEEDPSRVSATLDDTLNIETWLDFIEVIIREMKAVLHAEGTIAMVIGDVARSAINIISPAREAIRRVEHKKLFSYIGCLHDQPHSDEKTTRVWRETKGQATAIDRILILSNRTPEFNADGIDLCTFGDTFMHSMKLTADEVAQRAWSFAGLK